MYIRTEAAERHTLSVIVANEPGILARIAGMFAGRGYNIESLTVAEVTEDETVSRITIVTAAAPATIEQIIAQLDRLPPVHRVHDLTAEGAHVERELALVKVVGHGDHRIEALRLAEVYRARVVDATTASFVFEVTGGPGKINAFLGLMREVGLVEVARTGVAAIARGGESGYSTR
jgi:acetolactate synthase I/III small subunit